MIDLDAVAAALEHLLREHDGYVFSIELGVMPMLPIGMGQPADGGEVVAASVAVASVAVAHRRASPHGRYLEVAFIGRCSPAAVIDAIAGLGELLRDGLGETASRDVWAAYFAHRRVEVPDVLPGWLG